MVGVPDPTTLEPAATVLVSLAVGAVGVVAIEAARAAYRAATERLTGN